MKRKDALRCGYTTGSCATAAAKAAVIGLTTGDIPAVVILDTPAGVRLSLPVEDAQLSDGVARCAVRKDAGDDPDATNGILIYVTAQKTTDQHITIDGGEGVGRITRPGLDQPVGAAAINRVPRAMIEREMHALLGSQGVKLLVSVPDGSVCAKKTYNARLGIIDGISILGTTGIVEPMSNQALVDTIYAELDMLRAEGNELILMTPGSYGEQFAAKFLGIAPRRSVLCSNFLGKAVDYAQALGFREVLLVSHAGKLVKVAGGIFQTHSGVADARMEIIAAHAALAGAVGNEIAALLSCVSTDAAFDLLAERGRLEAVCKSLLEKIDWHLCQRTPDMLVGAVLFTNKRGCLGQTPTAAPMIKQCKQMEDSK